MIFIWFIKLKNINAISTLSVFHSCAVVITMNDIWIILFMRNNSVLVESYDHPMGLKLEYIT